MGKNSGKGKSRAFWAAYAVVLAAFCVAGILLLGRVSQRRQGGAFYTRLAGKAAIQAVSQAAAPEGSEGSRAEGAGPASAVESGPEALGVPQRLAQVQRAYPATVAWLQIPGTSIDYPVMQGPDNDYYLDHLPDGTENYLGSIFLDAETSLAGRHLILYGHNTSEEMFGLLREYESQAYYEEHPAVLFCAGEEVWECPIFSVRRAQPGGEAYVLGFDSDVEFGRYVDWAAKQSLYPIGADVLRAQRVLTLSTCTEWDGERLIVQALLPEDPALDR